MTRNNITENNKGLVGYTEEHCGKLYIYEKNGRRLGHYDSQAGKTIRENGTVAAYGNNLGSLLSEFRAKNGG